ncbi:hypothetical protein DSO57_1008921 [Entomophthora muscae]|uniref:Uncharacterized protein n=1 Tax=Entomophthora muscae TaxID=34485 RepID=A0ACC2T737_9FUNG|nr:hypothetical protein DSO57_1008921 [Entomophthora muscae]
MMAHLGLFAPILERLASVAVKVAVDSMTTTWPALYMLTPSDSLSNLPLQITCFLTISITIFCYTAIGSKMLKLSSQFGLLLVKQLTICLLYPHCISLNHAACHFTLTTQLLNSAPATSPMRNGSRKPASSCMRPQPTGLPPGLAHKLKTSLTTGKSSKQTSPTISVSPNPSKTLQFSSVIFLRRPQSQPTPTNLRKYIAISKTQLKLTTYIPEHHYINRMKPFVTALVCPEAITSKPALIAEAKHMEKHANMEYAARNSNCSSNSNGRANSNDNKRQNTKYSNGNSNCNNGNCSQSANRSCPKKEDTNKVNNAEVATHYESDPTFSDLEGLKTEEQGKEEGEKT